MLITIKKMSVCIPGGPQKNLKIIPENEFFENYSKLVTPMVTNIIKLCSTEQAASVDTSFFTLATIVFVIWPLAVF